jgi:hypothetical protein
MPSSSFGTISNSPNGPRPLSERPSTLNDRPKPVLLCFLAFLSSFSASWSCSGFSNTMLSSSSSF